MKHIILSLLLFSALTIVQGQSLKIHAKGAIDSTSIDSIRSLTFQDMPKSKRADKLAIVWTSGDPEVATHACFMFLNEAKEKKYFDTVEMIVWGHSSKLLSQNKDLQDRVKAMMRKGIIVEACKACADSYGVSGILSGLGIPVKYMGSPLSNMLNGDWHVFCF